MKLLEKKDQKNYHPPPRNILSRDIIRVLYSTHARIRSRKFGSFEKKWKRIFWFVHKKKNTFLVQIKILKNHDYEYRVVKNLLAEACWISLEHGRSEDRKKAHTQVGAMYNYSWRERASLKGYLEPRQEKDLPLIDHSQPSVAGSRKIESRFLTQFVTSYTLTHFLYVTRFYQDRILRIF